MKIRDDELEQLRRAAAAREDLLARAANDFTTFVEVVGRDESNRPFVLAPHHLAWHAHVQWCWNHNLFAGIVAPWGSGKSMGMIAPMIAFLLGRNPNWRIKVVCADDVSAMKRVGLASRILMSPAYRRIFPAVYKGGVWTKHELYVNRPGSSQEPSVEARGVFSTGIGARADFCLYDDVVDQKNSAAPDQRARVKNLLFQTWTSRLESTGLALHIATLWHLDDATHDLMAKEGWCFLVQKIKPDLSGISQELIGAGAAEGYPGLVQRVG